MFREAVAPGAKSGIPKRDEVPADLPWRQTITPDPVSLFRFSAITFNPHRIHYDRPYAMEIGGLSGPRRARAVHAALPHRTSCATTIPAATIRTFHMRARAPLFEGTPFDLVGRPTEGGNACEAWAVTPSGTIAMQATATFA